MLINQAALSRKRKKHGKERDKNKIREDAKINVSKPAVLLVLGIVRGLTDCWRRVFWAVLLFVHDPSRLVRDPVGQSAQRGWASYSCTGGGWGRDADVAAVGFVAADDRGQLPQILRLLLGLRASRVALLLWRSLELEWEWAPWERQMERQACFRFLVFP